MDKPKSKLVKTFAATVCGIHATTINVEVEAERGASFTLVGLPDAAVKESHRRVVCAIKQSGFDYKIGFRYLVNLSPADIRKEGTLFDLPIAIAILACTGQVPAEAPEKFMIMGELSLDGSLQPVRGVLPMALHAHSKGFAGIIVPKQNALEAAVVSGLKVYGAETLSEVVALLKNEKETLIPTSVKIEDQFASTYNSLGSDFSDVKGQENVKRAMEVAAAGGHNIVLIGPPGSGKSMIAKRLPSILPPFTLNEALETTAIHSVAGTLPYGLSLLRHRPFRAPHHTLSSTAMVGGGANPLPGEVSLAHNGVLFLDELPEYARSVLEVLRQPLEDREVSISRTKASARYPSSFMLVASMNPCPCGYYNHPEVRCQCPPGAVSKYLNKVSGPLLDRIDIQIEIAPVPFDALATRQKGEKSSDVRERVLKARKIQEERFRGHPGIYTNAQMTPDLLQKHAVLDEQCSMILKRAMEKFSLSARAYDRILKVARTIADLDGSEPIMAKHIGEAVNYRNLDRSNWGN
ncbi:MAG: YifB family Mg chelatase-like AAA ATPase [Porphyromonas sp.]|nr:YifB family Mg chelatase-like AAA ATPase [Porphyromonas sp.]